jgi:hypothetical protein
MIDRLELELAYLELDSQKIMDVMQDQVCNTEGKKKEIRGRDAQ